MARPDHPRRFRVGRGRDRITLRIRPRELLLQFREGTSGDDIDRLTREHFGPGSGGVAESDAALSAGDGFGRQPGDGPFGRRGDRLRSQLNFAVRVTRARTRRGVARDFLRVAREVCRLASPVYEPLNQRGTTNALAPIPGTFLVTLRVTDDRHAIDLIEDRGAMLDATWPAEFGKLKRFVLSEDVNPDDGFDLLARIRAVPGVEHAELDWMPVDPLQGTSGTGQWGLEEAGFLAAHEEVTGDDLVTIAVIDTGFDIDHPALGRWTDPATWKCFPTPPLPAGPDCVRAPLPPPTDLRESDRRWHGTAVAGIIAAQPVTGSTLTGVAPGCRLLPIRVTELTDSNIAAAVRWATSEGANVINLSLRSGTPHSSLRAAVQAAWDAGAVICASAGNADAEDRPRVVYPAAFRRVVAVGASVEGGEPKRRPPKGTAGWYSHYGPQLGVLAPGEGIATTDVQDDPGYDATNYFGGFSGTSASAPHVAGLAALLFSTLAPGDRVAEGVNARIVDAIERSCERVPDEAHYPFTTTGKRRSALRAYGRISADLAVAGFS